jgi:hypothetical protein
VKQLNDELGDGNPARAHTHLFDNLIDGLEVLKPATLPADHLGPGKKWGAVMDEMYDRGNALECIGMSIVVEIVGKQADCFAADEFRRQPLVPDSVLEWLHLHEELEEEHADESLELARLVQRDEAAYAAVARGAHACTAACWGFAKDMYALCYGAPPPAHH